MPSFVVKDSCISKVDIMAAIEKDAGDDPDVTHGSIVRVTIRRSEKLTFKAGHGVGKVSKPGLPIEVGEPAINPGPRKMRTRHGMPSRNWINSAKALLTRPMERW